MTMTEQLRDQAVRLAGAMAPELLTGAQAAVAVEDLATAEKAIASTLMFTALRAAKTDAWTGQGYATAADWFAAKAGVSVFEANRLLGTARRADRLPKTKEAMKKGDLSPDQADVVTDAATADPDVEEDLLGCAARDTHKKLREEAAKRKAAATDAAERDRRIRRNRSLRTGTDAEGAFWARLHGPGVDAARFEAMIRPFEELVFRQHRVAGRRDTYENRRYDALMLMLAFYAQLAQTAKGDRRDATPDEASTSQPSTPGPGSATTPPAGRPNDRASADPASDSRDAKPSSASDDDTDQLSRPADGSASTAPPPTGATAGRPAPATEPPPGPNASTSSRSAPPGPSSESEATWSPPWDPDQAIVLPAKPPGGDNVKVIVNVDHTALLRGHAIAGETCEIAGMGPVSVHAVREILRDDPFLAVVVRKGRDVVTVAHHGRGLNAHQRTAIEAGGLRCTNIACNRTIAIQIDHRIPYATDPTTALDNADPLCTGCHQLKTHHGHHLEAGTGPRRLLPPGHPDNPATRNGGPGASGHGADAESVGGLPTGKALVELANRRPLTPAEEHELENRCLQRLADRGHDITGLRMTKPPTPEATIEQPTLC